MMILMMILMKIMMMLMMKMMKMMMLAMMLMLMMIMSRSVAAIKFPVGQGMDGNWQGDNPDPFTLAFKHYNDFL